MAVFSYDFDGLLQGAGDLGIYRDPLNGRIDSTFLGAVEAPVHGQHGPSGRFSGLLKPR